MTQYNVLKYFKYIYEGCIKNQSWNSDIIELWNLDKSILFPTVAFHPK